MPPVALEAQRRTGQRCAAAGPWGAVWTRIRGGASVRARRRRRPKRRVRCGMVFVAFETRLGGKGALTVRNVARFALFDVDGGGRRDLAERGQGRRSRPARGRTDVGGHRLGWPAPTWDGASGDRHWTMAVDARPRVGAGLEELMATEAFAGGFVGHAGVQRRAVIIMATQAAVLDVSSGIVATLDPMAGPAFGRLVRFEVCLMQRVGERLALLLGGLRVDFRPDGRVGRRGCFGRGRGAGGDHTQSDEGPSSRHGATRGRADTAGRSAGFGGWTSPGGERCRRSRPPDDSLRTVAGRPRCGSLRS